MQLSRRGMLNAGLGLGASVMASSRLPAALPPLRKSITPGALWLDTEGKPIQAHGASLIYADKTFYWYGENKERTTGRDDIWHWGVRCYSSTDLYNWRDLGLIIHPKPDDPASPLHPEKGMDRPHILYNARTKQFVCWLKIMDFQAKTHTRTILTAPTVTGPWTYVRVGLQPVGMNAGDFDLTLNPADGKAYMYFERVHSEIVCADLTDDYTNLTGYYSTHLPRPAAPFIREAPAWFNRKGKQFLATSGLTGYFPNPTEIASADTFHGPWTTIGLLHRGDPMNRSFDSQISAIFKHPGKKDLYIALADRWTAGISRGKWLAAQQFYEKLAIPNRSPFTPEERAAYAAVDMRKLDTSQARYVWLPIRFDGDRPFIEWVDEWTIEEFE